MAYPVQLVFRAGHVFFECVEIAGIRISSPSIGKLFHNSPCVDRKNVGAYCVPLPRQALVQQKAKHSASTYSCPRFLGASPTETILEAPIYAFVELVQVSPKIVH